MLRTLLAAALALFTIAGAQAQNTVIQGGSVTPGHAAMWIADGVIQDAGSAAGGGLTSIGVTNNGGPGICLRSSATGAFNLMCFTTSTTTGVAISLNNIGGATGGFSFILNGVAQGFPLVQLPVAANDLTCFADTSGTLKSCSGSSSLIVTNHAVAIGTGGFAFRSAVAGVTGTFLAGTGSSADPSFRAWAATDCIAPGLTTFGCVFSLPSPTSSDSGHTGQVLSGIDNSGNPMVATSMVLRGASSAALQVGNNASGNTPAFLVDTSTASSITGLKITAQTLTNGVDLQAISSGGDTTVPIRINGVGASGSISLNTSTNAQVTSGGNIVINKATPTLTFINGAGPNTTGTIAGQGTGGITFTTDGGSTIGTIIPSGASPTSWLDLRSGTGAGSTATLRSQGTGADHGLAIQTKGAGTLILGTSSNQITIPHVAGVTALMQLNGSNGGNPTITTSANNLALTCLTGCGTTTISPVTGAAVSGGYYPAYRMVMTGLNLNSAGAEVQFVVAPPAPATRFRISSVGVINTGTTASLTTATLGGYSATGGGGTTYFTGSSVSGCTSNTPFAAGQFCNATTGTGATRILAAGNVFIRVDNPQGAAATADIVLSLEAIP